MTYKIGISVVLGIYLGLVACNQNTNQNSKPGVDSIKIEAEAGKYRNIDTAEDCAKPTK